MVLVSEEHVFFKKELREHIFIEVQLPGKCRVLGFFSLQVRRHTLVCIV